MPPPMIRRDKSVEKRVNITTIWVWKNVKSKGNTQKLCLPPPAFFFSTIFSIFQFVIH
jgi:hypothetical protein